MFLLLGTLQLAERNRGYLRLCQISHVFANQAPFEQICCTEQESASSVKLFEQLPEINMLNYIFVSFVEGVSSHFDRHEDSKAVQLVLSQILKKIKISVYLWNLLKWNFVVVHVNH